MADMNEMIQALGPGLGHMLAIQQQRNSQNQVQAQTGATLESTLRSQQQRGFDAQKHPLTLEEMMLRNKDKSLENQVAQRKWNIESATPEADVIAEQGYATQGKLLERMTKGVPPMIAAASAIPNPADALAYVQDTMTKLGAPKHLVEQFSRFESKEQMLEALKNGFGRIQGEATPKLQSAETIAGIKAGSAEDVARIKQATAIRIQEMKNQLAMMSLQRKMAIAQSAVGKPFKGNYQQWAGELLRQSMNEQDEVKKAMLVQLANDFVNRDKDSRAAGKTMQPVIENGNIKYVEPSDPRRGGSGGTTPPAQGTAPTAPKRSREDLYKQYVK